MPVVPTDVKPLDTQYPHVDNIEDWRAQQSVRLLWDRVFALAGRLAASEKTIGDLVALINRLEDQVYTLQGGVGEALAPEQQPGETDAVLRLQRFRRGSQKKKA